MNASTTWQTWREAIAVVLLRRNLKKTFCIAVTVGSIFFTMNQLGVIIAGDAGVLVWLKAALTYLTPLCVSNFGILSATRAAPQQPSAEAPC